MKDVIEHLVEDLDWRLSPAGKTYRPDDKELTSWGAERHGCWPAVLLWFVMMLVYIGGVVFLAEFNEDFFAPVGSILGLVLSFFFGRVAGNANKNWQKQRDKQAYRKLLKSNERFMLVEYSKYLSRKVHQAQRDPTLGGAAEITRLLDLQQRITEMLRKGGSGRPGRQSRLEEEATIAESLLEAYGHEDYDPLKKLDERLPAEVRERLKETDRQTVSVQTSPTAQPAAQAAMPGPGTYEPAAASASAATGMPEGPGAVTATTPPSVKADAPRAVSKAESELPRWARELGQIIESLDLGDVLSDESRKTKPRSKEKG